MTHTDAEGELPEARRRRDLLRDTLTRRQTAKAAAERAFAEARSRFGDDDRRTIERSRVLRAAEEDLQAAAEEHRLARERVAEGIRAHVERDIGDDFTRLATTLPIVFLPIRLETRFAIGGDAQELWIRVYPDDVHADSHERELTSGEVAAARAYWTAIWRDPAAAKNAWKVLLASVPAPRAAWVVRELTPRNVDGDHSAEPDFPEPAERLGEWTRAVEARLLPDRWVAIGYRGGQEAARAVGRAIVEPLAVTLAPDASAAQQEDISGDGLVVDEAVRWTIDFERAVEVGMALRMPLAAGDVQAGFDELLVVGVKASLAPQDSSAELAGLFEAHHYGRGLAFVRQGTPTNNTQQAPSGYPPADPDGERSFGVEQDPARTVAGRDGERFAQALGLPAELFRHVERGDADEWEPARAMCGALWPATWGYFFEELLLEGELDLEVEAFRDYFVEHVRARGHAPAFRVGGTPYGLVVTSSLSDWKLRGRRALIESAMPDDLRRLRSIWAESAGGIPRVGKTADPDKDLLEVLEMDASAREVRVRSVVGPNASLNLGAFFGLDWDNARRRQLELAQQLALRLGRVEVGSLLFALTYGSSAPPFAKGFVVPKPEPDAPEPLSETALLEFNYIRWLRTAPSIEDVRHERLPAGVEPPNTLLYLLLRHAMLREAARTSDSILVKEGLVSHALIRDRELVGASTAPAGAESAAGPSVAATATVWERMSLSVPAVSGNSPLSSFVWTDLMRSETRRLREFRSHLETLEDLPTAELERLLTETLDLCSHRLDAWISSMFVERLSAMRRAEGGQGSVLGSFGWVLDLRAKPSVAATRAELPALSASVRRRLRLTREAALEQQTSSGGFTHAPSMSHAATAAILRNGFLSRRGVDDQRYGVDLSSARVRRGRWVLDAIRNGQPLGAVLGYQFERALHDARLDRYKEPFRRRFPVVAGKLTQTAPASGTEPAEAVEAVAARNVVDGHALHLAWQADAIPWGLDGIPVRPGADFDRLDALLRALDETIDAVADLLMAEAVYQLVQGNTAGASASLDALARGVRPPDPEVVKTPRGGSTLTHRAALVLGGNPMVPPGWGAIAPTPRSAAEPWLDGWLGALIGDPAKVRCAVSYTDLAAVPAVQHVEVTLAQLGLRPIDVFHAVSASEGEDKRHDAQPTSTAQASELDARVAAVALARPDADPLGEVRISYAPTDRANTRSFAEIAELLRAVQSVLSTARALESRDLLASAQAGDLASATIDEAGLAVRAANAIAALTAVRDSIVAAAAPLAVDPTPVNAGRGALVAALRGAAAFGVPGAFVASPHTDIASSPESVTAQQAATRALVARAASAAAELTRRIDGASAEPAARARLALVFGDGFRVIAPFTPAANAIAQALTTGPTPAPSAPQRREWLRGAALVRPPLDRYHRLSMLQRALGGTPSALTVTQVPHVPGAGWIALPFPDEDHRPPSGTLGLALLGANGPLPGAVDSWAGLLIDEWTELIPNTEEATAVAIHYDDPGAEAPQAILVAVPPDEAAHWTLERVTGVLRETLLAARLRAVDGDLLGSLSQILPAAYLAANPRADTVSATFAAHLRQDPLILRTT
jgi:hypothetical protein